MLKFYDIGAKSSVDVDEKSVKVRQTANGRYQAVFETKEKRMVRFISKEDFERLSKKKMKKPRKGKKAEESKEEEKKEE